jgi:hypothetical protein
MLWINIRTNSQVFSFSCVFFSLVLGEVFICFVGILSMD